MKWLSVFLILSTIAIFSRAETTEHLPIAPETQGRPQAEPASPFQQCEQTVLGIYPKYFGRIRSQREFHVMLACAGLQGDPLQRKGWKNYLPICPAEPPAIGDWIRDWDGAVSKYHICAETCFRHSSRKSWGQIIIEERKAMKNVSKTLQSNYGWFRQLQSDDVSILDRHYPAQQCCYSRGKLITEGPGAGTPDIIFISPRKTPQRLRPTGPLRAALFHEYFDVEVIKERFPNWPKGWSDYWKLGWGPVPTRAPKYWGVDSHNRSCEYLKD